MVVHSIHCIKKIFFTFYTPFVSWCMKVYKGKFLYNPLYVTVYNLSDTGTKSFINGFSLLCTIHRVSNRLPNLTTTIKSYTISNLVYVLLKLLRFLLLHRIYNFLFRLLCFYYNFPTSNVPLRFHVPIFKCLCLRLILLAFFRTILTLFSHFRSFSFVLSAITFFVQILEH